MGFHGSLPSLFIVSLQELILWRSKNKGPLLRSSRISQPNMKGKGGGPIACFLSHLSARQASPEKQFSFSECCWCASSARMQSGQMAWPSLGKKKWYCVGRHRVSHTSMAQWQTSLDEQNNGSHHNIMGCR